MANIIKIKRGLKANLPALAIGELAYCTDTKELFIGVNTGTTSEPIIENILVALDPDTIFDNPTFTGDVKIGTNSTLTGIPIPLNADSAVNKAYVDDLITGIKARTSAFVFIDQPLDGTYNDGPTLHEFTADQNGPFPESDGVSSSTLNTVGARMVLSNQADPAHNGLYVLKTPGDAGNPWVIQRCEQCDTSEKIPGSFVLITKGTEFKNSS